MRGGPPPPQHLHLHPVLQPGQHLHHHHQHIGMRPPPPPPPPPHAFMLGPHGPMGPGLMSGDLRIHELNNRLSQRPRDTPMMWWDAFANEFFEDDAQLQVSLLEDVGPRSYCIGRALVPRFFHHLMDACEEAYLWLRAPREMSAPPPAPHLPPTLVLTCEAAELVTSYVRNQPCLCKVFTDTRLLLEFACNDRARIRLWRMEIRDHHELMPRQALHAPEFHQLPPGPHQAGNGPCMPHWSMSKPVSRAGLPSQVVQLFQISALLEPMQSMMAIQKCSKTPMDPRECLKQMLHQHWQRMVGSSGPVGGLVVPPDAGYVPGVIVHPAVAPAAAAVTAGTAPGSGGKLHGGGRGKSTSASTPRSRKRPKNADSATGGGEAKPAGGGRGGGGRKRNAGSAAAVAAAAAAAVPPMPMSLDSAHPGEVMVVGEPGLMGGQAGQEDERLITRLENSHYAMLNRFGTASLPPASSATSTVQQLPPPPAVSSASSAMSASPSPSGVAASGSTGSDQLPPMSKTVSPSHS